MAINDIGYVIYRSDTTASQVKILSDFTLTPKSHMYGLNCRAQFLMQYNMEKGWQPFYDRHFERTQGIYRVSKKSLFATWEEAKEVLKANLEKRINSQKAHLKNINESIIKLQLKYSKEVDTLEQLKQFNIEKHFSHNNEEYISPFTGLLQ